MIERVGDDPILYRIRLPFANLGEGESNCYGLVDEGQWLIVDSGAAGLANERRLRAALCELGADFGACRVFLTHGHFDHGGLLSALLPASVPLYLSRAAFEARQPRRQAQIQGEFRRLLGAAGVSADDACAYGACNAETVSLPPGRFAYRFVGEGDEIAVGRCRFRVLETPGHTPDHCCLYEPERGILFGGDHLLFAGTPAVDVFPDGVDGLTLYERHLRRVGALPLCALFPGHGDPVSDAVAVAARAGEVIARKHARIEAVSRFLREAGAATGAEVARQALAHRTAVAWRAAAPMTRYYFTLGALVVLRHLVCTGCAVPQADATGTTRFQRR